MKNLLKTRAALIAGEGEMPLLIAKEMLSRGIRPLVFVFEPKQYASLQELGLEGYLMRPTQVAKACRLMRLHGVKEVTWSGRVRHTMVIELRPWHLSFSLMRLWFSLADTRTDTLLGALCRYFEREGLRVVSSLRYLNPFVLKADFCLPELCFLLSKDALLGIAAAKTLGALDIGQAVVVRNGTVIAVEAIEGTDACLDRAKKIGSRGATLVKMAKPGQDLRFDVPVLGETTFQKLLEGDFRTLVVEENQTLCLHLEALEKARAEGLQVVIVGQAEIAHALKIYGPKVDVGL